MGWLPYFSCLATHVLAHSLLRKSLRREVFCTHKMIRQERSVFWEVTLSVIVRQKFVCTFVLIPNGYRNRAVWICTTEISYVTVGVGWRANFIKEKSINETLAFWKLLLASRNQTANSEEYHEIFAHKLHCALKLTVGFSKSYCEQ